MKKLIAVLLMLSMLIHAAFAETTPEMIMDTLGLSLNVPADAGDVEWRMDEARSLAAVSFSWHGVLYTMQVMPGMDASVFIDSDNTGTCLVDYCEAVLFAGEDAVTGVAWCDLAPGLVYSLSAESAETDIVAVAGALFTPVQGDADENMSTIDAFGMLNAVSPCTGYEGTAGASLKQAVAAYGLLVYAVDCNAMNADAEAIAAAYENASAALPQYLREELPSGLAGVMALIDAAFADYPSVSGLFDDGGVGEGMTAIIADESAAANWESMRSGLIQYASPAN